MDHTECLHVFDLPQLYTKPSAEELLRTLSLLTSTPPSWDGSDSEEDFDDRSLALHCRRSTVTSRSPPQISVSSEGLPSYLTRIVGSDLHWIEDEAAKEMIWEQASLRLSERSGRSAMPAMTRTFQIPTSAGKVEIALHEPAMTADNIGFKTWGSSYQLAKRLEKFKIPEIAKGGWILELGSGTGLVGIAAASVLGCKVCVTDLADIVPNLQRNVDANVDVIERRGGNVCAGVLDWTQPDTLDLSASLDVSKKEAAILESARFPVILVADALYSSDHPRLLVNAVAARLSEAEDARVIVELPLRDSYAAERKDFRERMLSVGLCVLEEGEETGYDDWGWSGDSRGGLDEVRCWWSVWQRV